MHLVQVWCRSKPGVVVHLVQVTVGSQLVKVCGAGHHVTVRVWRKAPVHPHAAVCLRLQDTGIGGASLAAAACAAVPRHAERENLKDFMAKKRETFLVQVRSRGAVTV